MASALSRLDRRRLVISFLLALALVALWLGATRAVTGESAVGTTDPAIENVSPRPDELVLRQTQVVVDLAPGYRGELYIDGIQIPVVDAVNNASPADASTGTTEGLAPRPIDAVFDPALNTITFTPTVGAAIEEFAPRSHQVTVHYWKFDELPEQGRYHSWSFRVQG